MPPKLTTVLLPTRDAEGAKALFTALLGTGPSVDSPYYIGFDVEGLHLGINPNGFDQGLPGPVAYWAVDDIAATMAAVVGSGGKEREAPHAVGGGRQVASFEDADGNIFGLMQDG